MECFVYCATNMVLRMNVTSPKLTVLNQRCEFRKLALEEHEASKQHHAAITTEMLSRVSVFHKEYVNQVNSRDEVLSNVFQACYFFAKHEISNRKLIPFLEFLEQVGLKDIQYFKHRSEYLVREIFLTIGRTIKEMILEQVREAGIYGLLADDATDIAVMEQMVTFVSCIDPLTSRQEVKFLFLEDVLNDPEADGANAGVLLKVLLKQLEDSELKIENLMSLASDGASVMTGQRNGLAAKLKAINSKIISFHCICHRLALSCVDSNDETSYVSVVETILWQLWKIFENFPKKTSKYLKIQLAYKSLTQVTCSAKKIVLRKVRKSCRTRWLSLDRSVEGVYLDFVPHMQTLQHFSETDAVDAGLLSKMRTPKFIGAIYILNQVLPALSTLSKTFQKGTVNFARIKPAIKATQSAFDRVVEDNTVITQMQADLAEDGRLSLCGMNPTPYQYREVTCLLSKYVVSLKKNIDHRFQEALPVVSSFSIFDPLAVPPPDDTSFRCYGSSKVKILAAHYYSTQADKEKLHAKEEFKTETTTTSTPTVLHRLITMKETYSQVYPMLYKIAQVCTTMPVSDAWPERGLSTLRRVKTRLRSRMKNDLLEALMHVSINSPAVSSKEGSKIIDRAVKRWSQVRRRKLPNVRRATRMNVSSMTSTSDVQVH